MNNRIYVRDDAGELWFFEDHRIRMLAAENVPDNGYVCASFEEGIQLLNKWGYITNDDAE